MNMSKSRDIRAKMPSPKVIFYAFWLVTVKVLNSYIKFYIYFLIVRINTILSSILKYKKTLILPRIYHD